MSLKSILPETSNFYLNAILLMICSVVITLIITIKLYVWNLSVEYEDKTSLNYFFIENHSFIMTTLFILVGFSMLVPRLYAIYHMKLLYTTLIHGLLNGVAIVLSLVPMYTLLTGLLGSKISIHYYSIHCWFGGIAIFLYLIQFLIAIAYHCIYLFKTPSQVIIKRFVIFHKNTGNTVFGLICLSFILGISEKNSIFTDEFPKEYNYPMLLTNALALSVLFFSLIILYLVFTRTKLETAMNTIKTQRMSEKKRFVNRVVEKQEKNKKKNYK